MSTPANTWKVKCLDTLRPLAQRAANVGYCHLLGIFFVCMLCNPVFMAWAFITVFFGAPAVPGGALGVVWLSMAGAWATWWLLPKLANRVNTHTAFSVSAWYVAVGAQHGFAEWISSACSSSLGGAIFGFSLCFFYMTLAKAQGWFRTSAASYDVW